MASVSVGPHAAVKKTLFTLAPPTPPQPQLHPSAASPTSATTVGTPGIQVHAATSAFASHHPLLSTTTTSVLGAVVPRVLVDVSAEESARRSGIHEDEANFRRLLGEGAAQARELVKIRSRTVLEICRGGADECGATDSSVRDAYQRSRSDAAPPLKLRREESANGGGSTVAVVSRRSSSTAASAAQSTSAAAAADAPHIPLDVARQLIAALKRSSGTSASEYGHEDDADEELFPGSKVREALAQLTSAPVNEAAGGDALHTAANQTLSEAVVHAFHRNDCSLMRACDIEMTTAAEVCFRDWINSDGCDLIVAQRCVLRVLAVDEVGDGSTRVATLWYRCCCPRVRAHLAASLVFHADVIASLLHVGANHRCEATVSRCVRLLAMVSAYVHFSQLQILDATSALLFLARVNERLAGLAATASTSSSALITGVAASSAEVVALQTVNQYLQANLRLRQV